MARFDSGWVKLYRKAVLGDIGSNYTRGGLFGTLLVIANIQSSTVSFGGKPRKLVRGQIVTSLTELAALGEVDRKTVLRHLNYLRLRGTVNYEICSTGALITIENYERYQGQDADSPQQGPNDMDNDRDNDVPHIEERKKERKKEQYAFFEDFERLARKYRDTFPGTTTGTGALERFKVQIKSSEESQSLDGSMINYRALLDQEDWRKPKTTFANYLGTKRSGFFWTEFKEMPNLSGGGKQWTPPEDEVTT